MNNERIVDLLYAVGDGVKKEDFERLCHGDLAFLQDAVLNNDYVIAYNCEYKTNDLSLNGPAENYKLIQRKITINGIEVPEPVRKPLEKGQRYYVVFGDVEGYFWGDDVIDEKWLNQCRIHLTEEARDKHEAAWFKASGGEL